MEDAQLGRLGFTAYNDAGPNPWKTHDGKDVPTWDQLNDQVRGKWTAAAKGIRLALQPDARQFKPHADSPVLNDDGLSNDGG